MNFIEAEAYLLSLGNEVEAMKLGLDGMRVLLTALGSPEKSYKKVQVAGTNGKGSVCAFLDSICLNAGIKAGCYTSPHLVSITERIRIAGEDIGKGEFAAIATFVREICELLLSRRKIETIPTFFEQVTGIALLAFANHEVDIAILETGLGGRLDATTAANADIAAITPIDYDHQEYLGNTLAEIAAEKAAIIHAGSQVVIAKQKSEALAEILERCSVLGIKPLRTEDVAANGGNTSGRECVAEKERSLSAERTHSLPVVFPPSDFATTSAEYKNVILGLAGHHQIENAKVAILLAETLQDEFLITPENVVEGLRTARHPGRLELMGQFLLDGAHNVAGATALRRCLAEFDAPITLIFGVTEGKDIGGIAEILFARASNLILTQTENTRSLDAREMLAYVPHRFDRERVFVTETADTALAKAVELCRGDSLVVVTGSLYLVGEIRSRLIQS